MQQNYIKQIINNYFDTDFGGDIQQHFQHWLSNTRDRDTKEQALLNIWDSLSLEADEYTLQDLDVVHQKMGCDKKNKKSKRFTFTWLHRVAAILLIALSSMFTYHFAHADKPKEESLVQLLTTVGETAKMELPDGSIVELNSNTTLLYPRQFTGSTRTVYLVGEANFKVKHDPNKPFIVRSSSVAVTALGTEFDVFAYPGEEEIKATLITGKLKVDCNEKDSYILYPNQEVIYMKKAQTSYVHNLEGQQASSWIEGRFVFRGATMKEILSSFERRNKITFVYNANAFKTDRYNITLRKNESLDELMTVLNDVSKEHFSYLLDGNICRMIIK